MPRRGRRASTGIRGGLLARVRWLFRSLALLLLLVEVIEWADAGTPLWPDRSLAAAGLVLALGWTLDLHRRATPRLWSDLVGAGALVVVGLGLGRPGAVLSMLLGSTLVRALHGGRPSVIRGSAMLLGGYVALVGILEGAAGVLSLATFTVTAALFSFASVIRLVAEVLARHDLAAAWDRQVAEAEAELFWAADRESVEAVVDGVHRALGGVGEAAGGLVRVPAVDIGTQGATPGIGDPGAAAELTLRLERIAASAELVRQRLESQARYELLAERSRDGIYVRDVEADLGDLGAAMDDSAKTGILRYVNPAAAELIPLLASDGTSEVSVSLEMVHADDHAPVRDRLGESAGILADPIRLRLRAPDEPDGHRWVEVHEVPSLVVNGEVVTVQGTIRDVTAQLRQEAALQGALDREFEAGERLRRVDDLRTTFLSAVSHELRTPLAALLGSAQTLSLHRERLTPQQAAELTDAVSRQAARLQSLLDDLLDVERLSRGIIVPKLEPTALLALVRKVVADAEADLAHVEVLGDELVLAVDPSQIERLVDNLLRNAVKHTPTGTTVRVEVQARPDGAVVVIEDDGPGIPEDLRDGVFAPFSQGPQASSAAKPGTGIGLSLVRKFAELHGGNVRLLEAASGGARFEVFLPDPTRVAGLEGHRDVPTTA